MTITIPPELEEKLQARADAEGLTVAAYVERIARDDDRAEQELEGLALAGLNRRVVCRGQSLLGSETPPIGVSAAA